MRRKYRSHVGIITDILSALYERGGENITKLMYAANLPYDRLKAILIKLENDGFVKIVREENENIVIITEKGVKLLEELIWIKKVFSKLGFKL